MRRYHFSILGMLVFVLGYGCAGKEARTIASAEPDSASVELAKKLNGGEMRFRAQGADGRDSVLSFLTVRTKNCVAMVGSPELSEDPNYSKDFVECDVDVGTGPIVATFKAKVMGQKRSFTIAFAREEANKYSLNAKLDISHVGGAWHGKGYVHGWLNQRLGRDGNVTATVHENVEF